MDDGVQRDILPVILELLRIQDYSEAYDVVEAHPVLLTEAAEGAATYVAEWMQAAGHLEIADNVKEWRDLLRQAREVGVAAAFQVFHVPAEDGIPLILRRTYEAAQAALHRDMDEPVEMAVIIPAMLDLIHHPGFGSATPSARTMMRGATAQVLNRASLTSPDAQSLLDSAVEILEEGLVEAPRDVDVLVGLGISRHLRYDILGDPLDLRLAISCLRQSMRIATTTSDGPSLASRVNLASALESEFVLTKAAGCLDESIAILREVVGAEDHGRDEALAANNNLALKLQTRFDAAHDATDLDESIEILTRALAVASSTGSGVCPERGVEAM